MIDHLTSSTDHTPHPTVMWHNVEIQPRRVALFRAWARARGQTDADLLAAIVQAGTYALAVWFLADGVHQEVNPASAPDVDRLLDDLASALGVPLEE